MTNQDTETFRRASVVVASLVHKCVFIEPGLVFPVFS